MRLECSFSCCSLPLVLLPISSSDPVSLSMCESVLKTKSLYYILHIYIYIYKFKHFNYIQMFWAELQMKRLHM